MPNDLADAVRFGLLVLATPGLSVPVAMQGRVLRYDPSVPEAERAEAVLRMLIRLMREDLK